MASVADAVAAAGAGADRVEMNDRLDLDGLTPSPGLVRAVRAATDVPIIAMVRAHADGFVYGADDVARMVDDIERLRGEGAAGFAFGALRPDGAIDVEACATLIEAAAGLECVMHRAVDDAAPLDALETLVDLGFVRILTSGGAANVDEGRDVLRTLVDRAAGRIAILPGGGVRASNAAALVAHTGCTEVHGSFRNAEGRLDADQVARTRAALRGL